MRDILKKISGKGRRGGDSFATLLFVVAAFAFAAATFYATGALMGSRDTTMSFVPMSATTYVHANGYGATEALLSSSSEMPAGIHPYEFALFTAPGDDATQHGTILAWLCLKKPNASELAILVERGATQLDSCHYFFGDPALATAAKVAAAAHASLSNNTIKHRALDVMRSLFSVQVMTNPREAVGTLGLPVLDNVLAEITPETSVIGVSIREHSFMARVTPLSVPLSDSIDRGVNAALNPARVKADIVLTEAAPDFDIASLFAFDTSGASGVTKDALAESDETLRAALTSPFELWIREATETRPAPVFLFHFPKITAKITAEAIARSFAIRNPTAQNFTLPDGDTTSEMFIGGMSGEASPNGDLTIGNDAGKVVVGSDGANGSLIGSSTDMLAEYRHPRAANDDAKDPCGRYADKLIINETTLLKQKSAVFGFLADKTGINAVSFSRSVGNESFFCGYQK